jgi:Protein of unknown function (DUF1348)
MRRRPCALGQRCWTLLPCHMQDNRIAVTFQYEYHNDEGQWFRAYGNEVLPLKLAPHVRGWVTTLEHQESPRHNGCMTLAPVTWLQNWDFDQNGYMERRQARSVWQAQIHINFVNMHGQRTALVHASPHAWHGPYRQR